MGWVNRMAKTLERLTPLKIQRLKEPGMYADGGGLYLQISGTGARSWIFRYRMGGRTTPRDMGLGSLNDVDLKDARDKAAHFRSLKAKGIDPLEARRSQEAAQQLEAAKTVTFRQCAEAYIASHREGWRNEKHASQWSSTLEAYVYPKIGKLPVGDIDIGHVLKVLEQKCDDLENGPTLWVGKTETATRVRGRIERILDWAKVRKYRQGENPARWRGNLELQLPVRSKVAKVSHHPALPYTELGDFMTELRAREGTAVLALEILILTATRTNEVIGARLKELDLDGRCWVIPAERMKANKEHRVPLSTATLAAFKIALKGRNLKPNDLIFPNENSGKELSENAMLALLTRMERDDITVHGFRSTFRDWAAERTNYPRDVAEMALAHSIGDKVEAAYRRGDLFEKRKRMMDDWAKFCATPAAAGKVLAINRRAK